MKLYSFVALFKSYFGWILIGHSIKNNIEMRTIFISFFFLLVTLKSFGQVGSVLSNETEIDSIYLRIAELKKLPRFTFRDIPIDGLLNEFVAKLKNQGFAVKKITDETAFLSGKFAGEDVQIKIESSNKIVYSVEVTYKNKTSWKSILTQYNEVRSMLNSKYGEPIATFKEFDSPYDQILSSELNALREGKCHFKNTILTKEGNGMVFLEISPDVSLVLKYVDLFNSIYLAFEKYLDY